MSSPRLAVLPLVAALAVAGCSGGAILANPPAQRPAAAAAAGAAATPPSDPQPIALPQDDAPHRRLTEWWYYTGHLVDSAGGRWGFEFVVFRAARGRFPVSWASHVALTDEGGNRFLYAQRAEIGPQVDESAATAQVPGFAFAIGPGRSDASPWRMSGSGGRDRLQAAVTETEAQGSPGPVAFAIDLRLEARRAPALHDRDGWVDFGPAGGSYYYSRTRLAASGHIDVADTSLQVTGQAWFDHQWGDFIAVGGGGWDWFAVNLDGGTDVTLSLVRDSEGGHPLVYGTLVRPSGKTEHLDRDAFSVDVTSRWRSDATGTDYPAGWRITIPAERLEIELTPTVAAQELDTRTTSGVVYWEGSQRVNATLGGRPIGGEAYVELTGYGPP